MPDTPPDRILIIRPSALGDVCRSVPVLVSLKRAFPNAKIDWLVQDAFAPAVSAHPDLTTPILFERQAVAVKRWCRADARHKLRALFETLKRNKYDLVIDCQGLGRSGFFSLVTGAKTRVGYANAAEFGWLGVNKRVEVSREMHTVDRMLALVEAIGVKPFRDIRLYTPSEGQSSPDNRLAGARYAVIAPTSRWEGKRWPADRFAELADALLASNLVDTLAIVGGRHERDQCAPLIARAESDQRIVDLVGNTTIAQLMGVIERSSLVVANDSAALHMGVGFDRPIVALFGPTRIDRVGPYQRDADVIQPAAPPPSVSHKNTSAGLELMRRITTKQVIDASLSRLAEPAAPRTYPSSTHA
ncbi:MAG: glycosyltransferase family 9 protein [Phycisphaerales bacterium]|nr:glycosyltransferase family 9 protein [Phycisphaerales bacterium]